MRRDPFQAIADPTRRQIINIISHQPLNLNAIADHFPISRPAISKQIKILHQCGLITIKQEGRERVCEANLQSLKQVSQWLEQYRVFWTAKLDALGKYLESTAEENAPAKKESARSTITHKKSKRK